MTTYLYTMNCSVREAQKMNESSGRISRIKKLLQSSSYEWCTHFGIVLVTFDLGSYFRNYSETIKIFYMVYKDF